MSTKLNVFRFLMLFCIYSVEIVTLKPVNELVFVHILYRHGDRNIISPYKNDPWANESYWPEGFGQLTNIGRQQHYELGAYLRERYFKLLPNNGSYHKNNIYVQSTDEDRTIQSAAHNLAGMFPPANEQIWNKTLMWQAIPIHTIPKEIDIVAGKRDCPLYNKAFDDLEQSDEIKTILKHNQSLIDYLNIHTGEMVKTICNVKSIRSTLIVEKLKNLPLPKWVSKVFYQGSDMNKLANFCFAMKTHTRLLARLKSGFLVREIFERFTKKINNTLIPNRSLWVYSAHDSTLANMLNTLNLFKEPHNPTYASCIFFELHKYNDVFYVEIYYKNYRGNDPVPLQPLFIPKCGQRCPLEKLYEIYKDVIPTKNYNEECQLTSDNIKKIKLK